MTTHDRLAPLSSPPAWWDALRSIASACLQGVAALLAGWDRAIVAIVPSGPSLMKAVHPPPPADLDDTFAPTMPSAFYELNEPAARDAAGAGAHGNTLRRLT